jgi:hypothetical protein
MKDDVLNVRVHARLKEQLRAMAAENHRTMSAQVSWLIEQEVRRMKLKEQMRGAA